jgi:hypothetical protein
MRRKALPGEDQEWRSGEENNYQKLNKGLAEPKVPALGYLLVNEFLMQI